MGALNCSSKCVGSYRVNQLVVATGKKKSTCSPEDAERDLMRSVVANLFYLKLIHIHCVLSVLS